MLIFQVYRTKYSLCLLSDYMPVIETLSKFIWKKIIFIKPILSFVYCFSLRIYILPWPTSFSWLIKYYANKIRFTSIALFDINDCFPLPWQYLRKENCSQTLSWCTLGSQLPLKFQPLAPIVRFSPFKKYIYASR